MWLAGDQRRLVICRADGDELAAADEETAIRGFKLEKKSQKVLLTMNLLKTARG